ncbi:MAG: beta-galactosidase [Candidatus Zixiibacteriota bacterium]
MIKIEGNKFIIGKETYYPFAAEMHYFRVDKRFWSICFERIRKAGFRIISTCIPWNLHEYSLGSFDFLGETDSRRDLVVFLELAREFGLKAILRPGPYIGAEWENGGYPEFIFENHDILARDSQNKLIQVSNHVKIKSGYVPSYNHPVFQRHVKRYIYALTQVIKNYIYPKGPVILIQLDHQLSFGHNYDPFQADYSEHNLKTSYPEFLRKKYEQIQNLNKEWKEKNKSFEEVQVPKSIKIKSPHHLLKYFDWIQFKEGYLVDFLKNLRELYVSFEITPDFYTDVFFNKEFSLPLNWHLLNSDEIFTGIDVGIRGGQGVANSYLEAHRHLRNFVACSHFPWASLLHNGHWSDNPKEEEKYFPSDSKLTKFILLGALSAGIKGFCQYMFVERDHWYGSSLANDGAIQSSYEDMKKINFVAQEIGLENLKPIADAALVNYRPYIWYSHLKTEKPFDYVNTLSNQTHWGLSKDLISLKYNHLIPELGTSKDLNEFKVLLVPCAEFMDPESQASLIDLAKKGKSVILFGLLPKFDLRMKKCEILSWAIKARTKPAVGIEDVEAQNQKFTSQIFGSIRSSKRYSVKAKTKNKVVGAQFKIGKGEIFLFTFDISSQLAPQKLLFLEEILSSTNATSLVQTSDPEIDAVVHRNGKTAVLYLINPKGDFYLKETSPKTSFILKLDCRKAGIKGKRIRLLDLLTREIIKTSASELKSGIMISMQEPDSRIYLVEGRKT